MKISTRLRYEKILRKLLRGHEPKDVVRILSLQSIHVVYNAVKWKKEGKDWAIKNRCRELTQIAIRKGLLLRKPCRICGEKKVDVHHKDYSDPLKIDWLCRLHHRRHHSEVRLNNFKLIPKT